MSEPTRKWDDLRARFLTSLVLIGVGGLAIWFGGPVLLVLVALVTGAMIWELVRMLSPGATLAGYALPVAGAAAALLVASGWPFWAIILAVLFLGVVLLGQGRLVFFFYGAVILIGPACLYVLREDGGLGVVLLVVLLVVVTDIGGYFVGRLLGGPKFWPRVSPKKTWSGTIAGWVGAALVAIVWPFGEFNLWIIVAAVALSLAAQMGDIAESAIKRRAGIKDSSDLLPGHGGFLDRFDGMIAAFSGWAVIAVFTDIFPGPL